MKQSVFKGEITVFLSLVFVLMISLVGSMIQGTMIRVNKSMKHADTQLALESVFAEYNKEILEQYGVFVKVDGNEEKISRRLWFYGAKNMEHQVQKIQLLTDNQGETFYVQAIRSMGGNITRVSDVSNENIQALEDENKKELEEVLQEGEVELPKENNPIEAINQLKKSSLLSLVLPSSEEVSNRYVVLEELPSHRELSKGNFSESIEDGVMQKTLFSLYLSKHFPNYVHNQKNHSLFYEAEYILAGGHTDQENLEFVAKKILAIRMTLNYGYLLTDQTKQAEAEALAVVLGSVSGVPGTTKLIKQAILFAWAYGESVLDLRVLFRGERVPVLKNSENWQLTLENLVNLGTKDEVKEERASTNGMNYGDYINALFLIEKREVLCMRALDLIELNVGVRVDGCVTALEIKSELNLQKQVKYTFITKYRYE